LRQAELKSERIVLQTFRRLRSGHSGPCEQGPPDLPDGRLMTNAGDVTDHLFAVAAPPINAGDAAREGSGSSSAL
jgi:hypothetical protein